MSMAKIKKDDEVLVVTGKYKGKKGVVLSFTADKQRVFVEGINIVKKCVKANPQANEKGGIVEKEASIHISNIALYDSKAKSKSKVAIILNEKGKKVRAFKKSGNIV